MNRKSLYLKTVFVAGALAATSAAHGQESEATAEPAIETEVAAEAEAAAASNIVEAAMASADHATLVSALQQAELVETLSGPGPFTVFAPTDDAFALVPAETLDALMQDAAKAQLATLLGFHVVPGSYTAETLVSRIEAAGGQLSLQTVAGQPITVELINDAIVIGDARGGKAYVTTEDLEQSNGVIHVVNSIIIPDFAAQQSAAPAETDASGDAGAE